MKIIQIKFYALHPPECQVGGHRLVEVPGLRRIQYTHAGAPTRGLPWWRSIEERALSLEAV